MLKFKVISTGKTKETWLQTAINEYLKRLQSVATIEFVWAKDDAHLVQLVSRESFWLCLDPAGACMTSPQFSTFLFTLLEREGPRLTFVIGGPNGIPAELKGHPPLSLSSMTFTHQMTRLILVEQLYRAIEIEKGSQYHK